MVDVEVTVVVRSAVEIAVVVVTLVVEVEVLPRSSRDELELVSCLEFFGAAMTAARSKAKVIKDLECMLGCEDCIRC